MTETDSPYPCVVVGFDGSPASHIAVSRGIARAGTTGKLYLVHAWHPPEAWRGRGLSQPRLDRELETAEALVEKARVLHPGLGGIAYEVELIGGPPAQAILDVAKARHADEIVLGTRGVGRVRGLLGSVAPDVIHAATCAVTVIPAGMPAKLASDGIAAATA
jgi:nucleotide-binding universal stress UspA family protein